jgi:hypothetical protein
MKPSAELAHLELLAEIDALVERMQAWSQSAPAWPPADQCRLLAARLLARLGSLRTRLESPLVIATLGGTGTGKSELVNALAGAEVVRSGRGRPTTLCPTMVCRPGFRPDMLGIDPGEVEVVERDLPALAQLVIIDCPDPDTSDRPEAPEAASPLARLRRILPYCDVLLVTTTQQKYRSARVSEELTAAAPGARTVFVQTHADQDIDIREDWRRVLAQSTTASHSLAPIAREHIWFVDSRAALACAQQGLAPQGEFAGLCDLLLRQYAGTASARIRRANFVDLSIEALANCRARLDADMPAIEKVQAAIANERSQLAALLAGRVLGDLRTNRRPWEARLLEQITSRWGLSPFSLVLRVYQGLGSVATAALLYRARTPAQLALLGAVEGARTWQRHRQARRPMRQVSERAAGGWDASELRRAATIIDGYALDAQFAIKNNRTATDALDAQAEQASLDFAARLAGDLDSLIARQAQRSSGFFTRMFYELLLLAMLVFVLFRLAKNFFYDSWLASNIVPMWGVEAYATGTFWLVLWSMFLVWLFTSRLRSGLGLAINALSANWGSTGMAGALFAPLENECRRAEEFRASLVRLQGEMERLRDGLE